MRCSAPALRALPPRVAAVAPNSLRSSFDQRAGGNLGAVFFNLAVTFPWFWAAMGLIVCGGIGVTFGLYPAWKAASLDPIEALRHE